MAGRSKKHEVRVPTDTQVQSQFEKEQPESKTKRKQNKSSVVESLQENKTALAQDLSSVEKVKSHIQDTCKLDAESTPQQRIATTQDRAEQSIEDRPFLSESFVHYDPRSLHDALFNDPNNVSSKQTSSSTSATSNSNTNLSASANPKLHPASRGVEQGHFEYAPLSYISQNPLVSKIARINQERQAQVMPNNDSYQSQSQVLEHIAGQSHIRALDNEHDDTQLYQRQQGIGEKPLDFSKYYVEGKNQPKCVDLYLTYNYRSQAAILSAAFDVISKNTDVVRRPLLAKRQDIDLSQMVTLFDPNADAIATAAAKNKIMETFQQKGALTHVSERRKRVVETLNLGKRLSTAEYHDDGGFFKAEPPLSTMRPVIVHVPSVEREAQFVIRTIQDIQRLNTQASIAVLYRTHYAVSKIEDELLRAEIPYRVVGAVSFFERKEIQDALAYMRLRVNPDDDMALRRVINVPSRRFGSKRMELLESLARKGQCSLFKALLRNSDHEQLFARNKVNEFVQLILELHDAPLKDAAHDFELVMAKSGYEEWLKIQGEDERLDNLATLKKHVVEYVANQGENVNLADFLYSVMLLTDADDVDRNRREVQLMTVHCSKGLEFDYVFIISANEAIFPSRQAVSSNNIDEERRLMYVAMTRARKQLVITEAGGCVYMYLPGTLLNSQSQTVKLERKPSRFLKEIKQGHYAELGAHILEQKEAEAKHHAHLQSADTHVKPYQEAMETTGGMLTMQGLHKGFKFPEGAIVKHSVFGEGRIEACNTQEGEYEIFFTKLNRRRNITAIVGNRNLTLVRLPDEGKMQPQEPAMQRSQAALGHKEYSAPADVASATTGTNATATNTGADYPQDESDDYYTPDNLPKMPSEFYEADELAFSLDDPSGLNSN